MKGWNWKRVVGKILKSFELESSFQVLLSTWGIVKLESSFQLKAFQQLGTHCWAKHSKTYRTEIFFYFSMQTKQNLTRLKSLRKLTFLFSCVNEFIKWAKNHGYLAINNFHFGRFRN